MDVLLGAKVARERNAVEVAERLDDGRVLDGPHVEQQQQRRQQGQRQDQRRADQRQLAAPLVRAHRDERQERVRQQSARYEPVRTHAKLLISATANRGTVSESLLAPKCKKIRQYKPLRTHNTPH